MPKQKGNNKKEDDNKKDLVIKIILIIIIILLLLHNCSLIKKTGKNVLAYKAKNADSVLGANDCLQLSQLNEIARKRILQKHLKNGVNIPCTDGVIISTDVEIEANTLILPSLLPKKPTAKGLSASSEKV